MAAPEGYTIRDARVIDAEAIARVHVGSWSETYRGLMSERSLKARSVADRIPIWETALSQLTPAHVFLVVEDARGEVVGFAYGGPAREPVHRRSGELYALYLMKKCQGRGVGRALFARFREKMSASGLKDFYAMVVQGIPSRGYFLKMGGRACGVAKGPMQGRRGGRPLREERFEWV
ncbi:MAG: GNAT family N-acetyltransferase [Alphaproteobacteria bacterium]|nr:GNAT family N-acetyltransferase [Alphaproteobacteria bacterium]